MGLFYLRIYWSIARFCSSIFRDKQCETTEHWLGPQAVRDDRTLAGPPSSTTRQNIGWAPKQCDTTEHCLGPQAVRHDRTLAGPPRKLQSTATALWLPQVSPVVTYVRTYVHTYYDCPITTHIKGQRDNCEYFCWTASKLPHSMRSGHLVRDS